MAPLRSARRRRYRHSKGKPKVDDVAMVDSSGQGVASGCSLVSPSQLQGSRHVLVGVLGNAAGSQLNPLVACHFPVVPTKYVVPVWAKIKTLISSKLNSHNFFLAFCRFVSKN